MINEIGIDQPGMTTRPVANDAARRIALDIDGESQAALDILFARRRIDQRDRVVQPAQRRVAGRRRPPRGSRSCISRVPARTRTLKARGLISAYSGPA